METTNSHLGTITNSVSMDATRNQLEQVTPASVSQNETGLSRPEGVRKRRELRRRVLNFTPSWFSVNMGTGIASILLHELPYQFPGLKIIGDVIFALNVTLFVIFTLVSIARYSIWPSVWHAMIVHPVQSLFLGTFPMGGTTIANMVALACVPAFGQKFVAVAWVLWWIFSSFSMIICIGLPFMMFTRQKQETSDVTGVWLLPVVPPIVASASGAILAEVLSPAQARLTVIVSYIMWGTGFPVAALIMSIYFHRLAVHKVPPAAMIVSVFLPIGPCGQGAFALLRLSNVLRSLSLKGEVGPKSLYSLEEMRAMATAVYAVSVPIALVIWGLGLFWLIIAIATVLDMAKTKMIPFSMGWWGFTFPIGVFATATTQLAKELDSDTFKILGTIISLAVVALWLYIAFMTAAQAWQGTIFMAPCLGADGEPPNSKNNKRFEN